MGVVYKAEDAKLERTVALKFLADHLLSDPEAKERFLREAKAAAALHHSNVCPVHEIDEVDGKTFLAMAFLEGEPLEDRIAQGPLAIKDALDIARQVADGLDAAHAKGIVHRDIKPANIMVDAKGHATIMDFGLARLTEASRLTKVDTAMGTVAYMSPEQAQGMEVDHRTDIWALGCVLYEMVSGQRPFKGVYDQALLYEIVHEEPAPLTSIRAGVPMELEFIVGECLAKDRDDRTSAANDLARKLRTLAEKLKSGRSTILRTSQTTGAVPATMTGAHTLNPAATLPPDAMIVPRRAEYALRGIAAALALALPAVLFFSPRTEPPAQTPVRRFAITPPASLMLRGNAFDSGPSISPDGRHIAFTTEGDEGQLWVRELAQEQPRPIEGTAGAVEPFWSPDSEFIGFAAGRELRRVSVQGGSSLGLCTLPGGHMDGASWSPDGESIIFSSAHQLYEVPARGGVPNLISSPETFNELEGARGYFMYPRFLPAGVGRRVLLYSSGNETNMVVRDLETGSFLDLGAGILPLYSSTGHIVFQPSSELAEIWALPFSLDTLQTTGEAFPIVEDGAYPTAANDGTLLYVGGRVSTGRQAVWRDRAGAILETVGQPQEGMRFPALSPDGQRLAVVSGANLIDIWVHDLLRSTRTRLTFAGWPEGPPAWSPAGDEIVYGLQGDYGSSLLRKAADGTGDAVVLMETKGLQPRPDWSADGRYLVYSEGNDGNFDIRYLQFAPDGVVSEPVTFLGTPAGEFAPKLSPDGRFVAYISNESGRSEIYVRPFPDGAGRWQASVEGGRQPRWSRDGGELYYVQNTTLMSVSISTAQGVTLGQPQPLFQSDDFGALYDVSADGQRFLLTTRATGADERAAPPLIHVVQNWYEEFRGRQQ